ncbi:hypothetical protein [Aurantiacibacter luteus]|uniref:SH3 domain-containing protein n=1 Tax=Aurantiacibacter luteus TaxID=1581420 RepID=A0A0G9MUD3_9SPHN|nr:hypothetical protein [Aurantiacibacter luteus]KLE34164.1 hypothetical protein AAW00_07765 [Aurantiacibacter luteus]
MFRPIAVAAASIALLAAPALAQEEDPYARCAGMSDDAQRLACFDATYQTQRVVIAERAEERAAEIAENFGHRDRDEGIEREDVTVTSAVVEVFSDGGRRPVVQLANGQIWREISGSSTRMRPRSGWIAVITRHWSGAYEMRFEGRSGYLRVARIG